MDPSFYSQSHVQRVLIPFRRYPPPRPLGILHAFAVFLFRFALFCICTLWPRIVLENNFEDVNELHQWNVKKAEAHPCFVAVTPEETVCTESTSDFFFPVDLTDESWAMSLKAERSYIMVRIKLVCSLNEIRLQNKVLSRLSLLRNL